MPVTGHATLRVYRMSDAARCADYMSDDAAKATHSPTMSAKSVAGLAPS